MPYSQAGYFVAFVPFKAGAPSGPWEVFADGFAAVDPIVNTSDAAARPMGLAQGPDGSLYVSDERQGQDLARDVQGRSWIVRRRSARADGTAQAAGAHPHAGRGEGRARTRGPRRWREVVRKYCVACHQRDGKGDGSRFPSLFSTDWVSGNKSRLVSLVLNGLQGEIDVEGRKFNGVMPAHGFLSDEKIAQLLTFLRQNFGNHAEQGAGGRRRQGSGATQAGLTKYVAGGRRSSMRASRYRGAGFLKPRPLPCPFRARRGAPASPPRRHLRQRPAHLPGTPRPPRSEGRHHRSRDVRRVVLGARRDGIQRGGPGGGRAVDLLRDLPRVPDGRDAISATSLKVMGVDAPGGMQEYRAVPAARC